MSRKKVLLVKPSGRHGLSYAFDLIPTGLEYIAASIEDVVGEVMILDLEMEMGPFEEVMRTSLATIDPDVVGISISATEHNEGLKIAKQAKEKGALTVLGGYHPTALPSELLSSPYVDIVVRGEGELTMRELMFKGRPRGVDGLSYKMQDEIIHNPDRKQETDLDALPFPARHLRRYRYQTRLFRDREHDVLTASRGCFGRCTFCCEPNMSKGHQRYRSPQNILNEILEITSFHGNKPLSIEVTDPNFLGRPDLVEELCDLLAVHELDIRFGVKVRADAVAKHPNIIRKMISVGIEGFEMGIESPKTEDMNKISKGLKTDVHTKAVRNIKNWGGNAGGTFVIGLPDQTEEEIMEYPAYAKKIGLTSAAFGVATPFPGTPFYNEIASNNLITNTDWSRYDEMHSVFRTRYLTAERIEELASICMARFWTLDTFIEKERMRLIRKQPKRPLAQFVDDKIQELSFSLEMGVQLQGDALEKHVQSIVAMSADDSVEDYTKNVGLHNIVEMSSFLKVLGDQTVQLTIADHGSPITSWVMRTTGEEVVCIQAIPGRICDSTIDLEVDLMDFHLDDGYDLSAMDSIKILSKMITTNTYSQMPNLLRLFSAAGFESIRYLGTDIIRMKVRGINAYWRALNSRWKTPLSRRFRRLSY